MPYIEPFVRWQLDHGEGSPVTPGELNYAITALCLSYLDSEPNYTDYNELIGVLECVKLELYRRTVSAYEDCKRVENGDVYA